MKRSKLHSILTAIIDIIWAGLLWLVCSLPVVTLGPASAALYYAVVKCIRHERGSLTKSFFSAFRQNFRLSLPMWLMYLALLGIGYFNGNLLRSFGLGEGLPPLLLGNIFFLPLLLTLPWVFPVISRFDNSFGGTLRFTAALAVKNLGKSLLLALELAAALVIVWLLPQIAPLLPGVFALLQSLTIEPVLRIYTAELHTPDGDDWFNEE